VHSYLFPFFCTDYFVLEHALPLSASTEVLWEALDASKKMYIRATCNPADLTTMTPEKMSATKAYHFYSHILSLQDTLDAFAFNPIYEAAEEAAVPNYGVILSNIHCFQQMVMLSLLDLIHPHLLNLLTLMQVVLPPLSV
jgi:hypothetical protein